MRHCGQQYDFKSYILSLMITVYQDELTTLKADRRIFYPRMKYPPVAFNSVNWYKIDVFTSNIMVLHHKMSQTVKIKVNRQTFIY